MGRLTSERIWTKVPFSPCSQEVVRRGGILGPWYPCSRGLGRPDKAQTGERPQKKENLMSADTKATSAAAGPMNNPTMTSGSPEQVPVDVSQRAWWVPGPRQVSSLLFTVCQLFNNCIEYRTHTPSTDEVLETKHAETGFSLRVYGWTLTHCHMDPSQLQGEVTHCPSCTRCKSTWEMKGKKSNNLNNILSHRVIFL